jgi:hypothetical protein
LDDMYTFLVRGPSSRLPLGYVWLIPAWFVILGVAVLFAGRELSGRLPLWLGCTEVGSMLLAGCTLFCVLSTVRRHAFRVSSHGIWLGVRTTRKRPKLRQVQLAWTDIAQLRMWPKSYGVLLEITLGPAARIVHRPGVAKRGLLLLGSLLMPVGFGRGRPALTTAREDPPRYLVKLCEVTPAELRMVLATAKPAATPLLVKTVKVPRRVTIPPPRRPPGSRPGGPGAVTPGPARARP